jgi:hypothetical protein
MEYLEKKREIITHATGKTNLHMTYRGYEKD